MGEEDDPAGEGADFELAALLARFLEIVEAGEEPEALLRENPGLAEEVLEFAQLGARLAEVALPEVDEIHLSRAKRLLIEEIERRRPRRPRFRVRWPRIFVLAGALGLGLGLGVGFASRGVHGPGQVAEYLPVIQSTETALPGATAGSVDAKAHASTATPEPPPEAGPRGAGPALPTATRVPTPASTSERSRTGVLPGQSDSGGLQPASPPPATMTPRPATAVATPTRSPRTATPTVVRTSTPAATPTPTADSRVIFTPTPTPSTCEPTVTEVPTTPEVTETPTPTMTATPPATATVTPTPASCGTSTATPASQTATGTPSVTPTPTETPTPSLILATPGNEPPPDDGTKKDPPADATDEADDGDTGGLVIK